MLIFGDSYSTFESYIPEGYVTWYSEGEKPYTDVTKVTETWWHQVVSEIDADLIQNNSWSGSTIGYTGYDNADCSTTSCAGPKAVGFYTKKAIGFKRLPTYQQIPRESRNQNCIPMYLKLASC